MATGALRMGLIGAGGIARAHLRAYQQFQHEVQLVGVADVVGEAAWRFAQESGLPEVEVYTDPLELIRRPAVEAVDICTTHDQHAPVALAAAGAGKHVLVEKPMATSPQECLQMVEAARAHGVLLMVAQCQRYEPSYRAAREAIQRGELGRVWGVQLEARQHLRLFRPPGDWLYDGRRAGGGVVISVAVHKIDLARYLVGDVRRVTAHCRTSDPELFRHGAEDFCVATLEFASGAVGSLFATYSGYRIPYGEGITVIGTQGTIYSLQLGQERGPAMIASEIAAGEQGSGWGEQYSGFAPLPSSPDGLVSQDMFVNEIVHFARCCRGEEEPISSGEDNLGTMAVVFGIYRSASTGEPVELAEVF